MDKKEYNGLPLEIVKFCVFDVAIMSGTGDSGIDLPWMPVN